MLTDAAPRTSPLQWPRVVWRGAREGLWSEKLRGLMISVNRSSEAGEKRNWPGRKAKFKLRADSGSGITATLQGSKDHMEIK